MKNIFFTSDTHFFHKNIIKYCNRPFDNIQDMNETMVDNWNNEVSQYDIVYHLGDFSFGDFNKTKNILSRLNGKIHFIYGNHDKIIHTNPELISMFESVSDIKEIYIEKHMIVLCHYAMRVWNQSHNGSYHLYGHTHGTLKNDSKLLSIDVGVDCHNYKPISYENIKRILNEK